MSEENNKASKEQSNESKSIKTFSNISEPKPRKSEDIKKLLNSLLHKTLDMRLKRLESRYLEQKKCAELTGKSFELYKSQLKSLEKNMEETLKKKEVKINEEDQRRLKINSRKNLISKSVTPNKRTRINRKENNNGNKIVVKKKINLTKNKTENNVKEKKNMGKSLKDKRALSVSNLKIRKKNKKERKFFINY